ncbi:MAG: DUF5689 domain-containing protein [Bacteroidaceae bacterium]|nr:DUF5689 domain-containing protein [Bacteroidaceae bacterium]
MKKSYILLTLTLGFAASACQNSGWEDDIYTGYTIWNKSLQEHNVISVQELKTEFSSAISGNSFAQIKNDSMLRGTVICTDDGGNLTQQLVLQDGTSQNPGFIIIGVNQDALYNYIQPGQQVIFNLKGLYIGGYGKNGQLGYPSKNAKGVERIGRMTQQDFWNRIKFLGAPDASRIDTLDFANVKSLSKDQWAGCIVRVKGTINPKSTERWVLAAPEDADTGNGVTNTINVQGGSTLDLRTSTYADFASYPIEKDHVYTIYGVLSRYNDGWQLGMRTMSDINY